MSDLSSNAISNAFISMSSVISLAPSAAMQPKMRYIPKVTFGATPRALGPGLIL
ncbi:hypothetical protein EV178_004869 [Coemansia sp. RSA 1646]|nr:hypothetical protein EV178_004869 [Coemansia sp. RSA 1646]